MYHQKHVVGIIEDDDDLRDALSDIIASLGYRTELYASACEFVKTANTTQSVCLLVDIDLHGMTGLEVARRLITLGHAFPIVFITGIGESDLYEKTRQYGGIAVLQKPFFRNELQDALTEAVNKRA